MHAFARPTRPDMILIRVNQDKVLAWLSNKVQRVAIAIHSRRQRKKKVDNFASGFALSSSNVPVAAAETTEPSEPSRGRVHETGLMLQCGLFTSI